jgi:hypothetical protein
MKNGDFRPWNHCSPARQFRPEGFLRQLEIARWFERNQPCNHYTTSQEGHERTTIVLGDFVDRADIGMIEG